MEDKRMIVVGAAGDVGSGIVRSAVRQGWCVTAVGRNAERLAVLEDEHGDRVAAVAGDIGSDDSAQRLAGALGQVDAVVVSVSPPFAPRTLLEWTGEELIDFVSDHLSPHLVAARHLLPLVRQGGEYLGIGGGMADRVIPNYVPLAIAQSAQRQLYRGIVREARGALPARVRELLVAAFVDGPSTRAQARPDWIKDDEIGDHVMSLFRDGWTPEELGEPVLELRSPRALHRH